MSMERMVELKAAMADAAVERNYQKIGDIKREIKQILVATPADQLPAIRAMVKEIISMTIDEPPSCGIRRPE